MSNVYISHRLAFHWLILMAAHSRFACLTAIFLLGNLALLRGEPTPARFWISRSPVNPLPLALNADRAPEIDLLQASTIAGGESATLHLWAQPPRDAMGNYLTLRYFSLNLVGTSGHIDLNDDFEIDNPTLTTGGVTTSRFELTLDSSAADALNPSFVVKTFSPNDLSGSGYALQEQFTENASLDVNYLSATGLDFGQYIDNDPATDDKTFTGIGPDDPWSVPVDPSGTIANAGLAWHVASFSVKSLPTPTPTEGSIPGVSFYLQGAATYGEGLDISATEVVFAPPGVADTGAADLIVRSSTSLVGDFSGDGRVDGSDFLRWQRGYSASTMTAAQLWSWKNNLGRSRQAPTGLAVPEPAGLTIIMICFLLRICRIRDRQLERDESILHSSPTIGQDERPLYRSRRSGIPRILKFGNSTTKNGAFQAAIAILLVIALTETSSATIWWSGNGNGASWGQSTNWSTSSANNGPVPNPLVIDGNDLIFNVNLENGNTNNYTTNLNDERRPASLHFRGSGLLQIGPGTSGAGANNLLSIGAGGLQNSSGGTLSISSRLETRNPDHTWSNSGSLNIQNTLIISGSALTIGGAGTTTISGNIQSTSSALTKNGNGLLLISGNANYTGTTTINDGTFRLGDNNRIHDQSPIIVNGSGVFSLDGYTETIASLTGNGQVALGSGSLAVGANNASTSFSGFITGAGSLTKIGSGNLTLSGANSYTGDTNIHGGQLIWGNHNVISDSSTVAVHNSTLNLNGLTDTIGGLSGAGAVALGGGALTVGANNSSTFFSGSISGTGSFTKVGTGALVLTGTNSYTGVTYINGGQLIWGNQNAVSDSSTVVVNGGTLHLNGATDTIGGLSGGGSVILGSGVLAVGANGSDTHYSGVISGSGALIKVGSGNLTLFGGNSYTGDTYINGGQLVWGNHNVLSDSTSVVVNGGTLNLNGLSDTIGGLWGAGPVLLGGGTLAVGANGSNTTYSGALSGAGTFTKVGGGSLGLTGNLSGFSGNYRLQGGTLVVGAGLSMGTGSGISFEGGSLNMGQAVQTTRSVSLSGVSTIISDGYDAKLHGQISGSGTLVKAGSGDLWLTASNSNHTGGTRLDGGRLFVRNGGFGSGPLTINGGALFTGVTSSSSDPLFGAVTFNGDVFLNAATSTIDTYSNGATFNGVVSGNGKLHKTGWGTLILNGVNTYTGGNDISLHYLQGNTQSIKGNISFVANGQSKGVIFNQTFNGSYNSAITGEGAVTKTGAGTLELWGYNTYSSGTSVQQGALLGDSASFGTGPVSVSSGATLIFQQNVNGEFTPNITGLGSIRKTGSAALKLSGANNISGAVDVEAGKLLVNGSIAGPVTISSAATLGGSGTIGGSVTGPGHVAPGNSPGILTINGDYTQSPDSYLDVEIGGTAVAGVDYDQLRVGGTARLGGNINFQMYGGYTPTLGDNIRFLDTFSGGNVDLAVEPKNIFTPGLKELNDADKVSDPDGLNDLGVVVIATATGVEMEYTLKGSIAFDDDSTNVAQWLVGSSWTTNVKPDSNDSTVVTNQRQFVTPNTAQTVQIAANQTAEVFDLHVYDPHSRITVAPLAGSTLNSVTGDVTIGSNGAIELAGSTLAVASTQKIDVTGSGTLGGAGSVIGSVEVGVAIGASDATFKPVDNNSADNVPGMNITGKYTQGAGGVFSANLSQIVANSVNSMVKVSDEVLLDGALDIDASTLAGVAPGDTFTLISAPSGDGAFDQVNVIGSANLASQGVYLSPFYGAPPSLSGVASLVDTYQAGAIALPMGDADGDFQINRNDARVFAATILQNSLSGFQLDPNRRASNDFMLAFNFHADNVIDYKDIQGFKDAFAHSQGISAQAAASILQSAFNQVAVPEPNAILMLFLGSAFVAPTRRLRRPVDQGN